MAEPENMFQAMRADAKVTKYNGMVRKKKFHIDTTIRDEIQSFIIFARPGRKPFEPNEAGDLQKLIEDMEEVQAYRDRLSGILIQAKIAVDELAILRKAGEAQMYMEYSEQMKVCTNQTKRDAAMAYVLGPIIRAQEQWKSLRDIAEIARQNLNETYYALREIGENGRTILSDRKVKRTFD